MLTIDEALTLATAGVKPKLQSPHALDVPLFNLDATPIWREYLSGMRLALKRCKRGTVGLEEVAEHNALLLHEVIALSQNFKLAMRNAEHSLAQDYHWYAQPLMQHEQIHAALLTAYQGQPIPLHDHPGANGIVLVLSGKVQISRYTVVKEVKNNNASVALKKSSDRALVMGEADIFTAESANIHGMRALTPRCIMLDITIPAHQNAQRSWYLPNGQTMAEESHLFARRVEGEYFLPL